LATKNHHTQAADQKNAQNFNHLTSRILRGRGW
jgi:5-carboxymethyl-2-hydroxymuconate isomerase